MRAMGLPVIAVRPRGGEDVHPAVVDLHGQGLRVGKSRERKRAMRSAGTAASNLREMIMTGGAEFGKPPVITLANRRNRGLRHGGHRSAFWMADKPL